MCTALLSLTALRYTQTCLHCVTRINLFIVHCCAGGATPLTLTLTLAIFL